MPEATQSGKCAWATCSPMNLLGSEIFANRDAGLVGQGFLANGLECKSILLAPAREGDYPNIIRATREEMENPAWWAGTVRNGVVFYNALKTIHTPVLCAAKAAGLPIAINVDSTAMLDFQSAPRDFWQMALMHKSLLPAPRRQLEASGSVCKNYYQRFNGTHRRLAAHLAIADVIGAVTPDAAVRLRRFLTDQGQPEAAGRVHLIPHPVHPRFVMPGDKANNGNITFVTVGRWSSRSHKRPDLLMQAIDSLLASDSRIDFRIFGLPTPEMQQWHASMDAQSRNRVALHGKVPNAELLEAYQQAHIYLCVSAYESFLIAGAEAMCCGCSIVACDSPSLPGPKWFASDSRGTLSDRLTPNDLAHASLDEVAAWRQGGRDARQIAAWAQQQMHATQVAASYVGHLTDIV